MGKRESPKSVWNTGVSVFGAFKLDQLQPAKLTLLQTISTFLTFILEAPITRERERKKGSSRGWKWGKGNHPKVDETQGFLYLRHLNWTICGLLSWLCYKQFLLSWPLYWGSHFLLPQREDVRKWEKGNHPKVIETQGFLYLEHSNWTICRLLSWFCKLILQTISTFLTFILGIPFLIAPERKQQRLEMEKR